MSFVRGLVIPFFPAVVVLQPLLWAELETEVYGVSEMRTCIRPVVLKLFQEEAPLRRVNSFVAPPKENS